MKLSTIFLNAAIAAAFAMAAKAAPACGSVVSGKVVLDADMACDTTALVVGADNTTIDLNGHTISCTGPGYQGSCQGIFTAGVYTEARNNVVIKGPGKFNGFQVNLYFVAAKGATVRDLELTGPASPGAGANPRMGGFGIAFLNTGCDLTKTPGLNLVNNTISNQLVGIQLDSVACAKLSRNHIHDINSDVLSAMGIWLNNAPYTSVDGNRVERVGQNRDEREAGITVGGDSEAVFLTNNVSSNNCGDGIHLNDGAFGVTVKGNLMRNNGRSSLNGQCRVPTPGAFFDLAERAAGAKNSYGKGNQCDTQYGPIPAGICDGN